MKRSFADLHLRVNVGDRIQIVKLAQKAAELGYTLVGAQLAPQAKTEEIQQLKKACLDFDVDFVSRVDLHPRSQEELLGILTKLRRRFEIICIVCTKKDVARQAAKDRRVDLLNFPSLDFRERFFDHAEAELASCGSAGFEVDVKSILVSEGPPRIRFLSSLRREVALALEFQIPVVISSGVSDPMLLRKPREMAILASLFGLGSSVALDSVSEIPAKIVKKNRGKLDNGYVAPGIRIIKQGEKR